VGCDGADDAHPADRHRIDTESPPEFLRNATSFGAVKHQDQVFAIALGAAVIVVAFAIILSWLF
jgi:hypothetical protein